MVKTKCEQNESTVSDTDIRVFLQSLALLCPKGFVFLFLFFVIWLFNNEYLIALPLSQTQTITTLLNSDPNKRVKYDIPHFINNGFTCKENILLCVIFSKAVILPYYPSHPYYELFVFKVK